MSPENPRRRYRPALAAFLKVNNIGNEDIIMLRSCWISNFKCFGILLATLHLMMGIPPFGIPYCRFVCQEKVLYFPQLLSNYCEMCELEGMTRLLGSEQSESAANSRSRPCISGYDDPGIIGGRRNPSTRTKNQLDQVPSFKLISLDCKGSFSRKNRCIHNDTNCAMTPNAFAMSTCESKRTKMA